MKLSIVLSAQPTQFAAVAFKGDFERNMARIAALGYDGVELAIREPAAMAVDNLLMLLERYNLAVPAIGTGQAWGEERLSFTDPSAGVRAAAVERACAHVPFASRVGAQIVIGLLRGVVQDGVPFEQAMAWLVDALRQVAAVAAKRDVKVCLEPLNRYETGLIHTVAGGLALLDDVGCDNVGLLLDTFHMNIEEPDIAASIRQAGDRLFHFHVADSNRWYPGAGHIDFGEILRALDEAGYDGFISCECLPLPDPDKVAVETIKFLRAFDVG